MAYWATATLPLKELSLLPAVSSRTSGGTSCCKTCYLNPFDHRRKGTCHLYKTQIHSNARASVVSSRQSPVNSNGGVWEDPDDGSDSDCDDEPQVAEENDLDFESDWEDEKDSSVATIDGKLEEMKYEDELAKGLILPPFCFCSLLI